MFCPKKIFPQLAFPLFPCWADPDKGVTVWDVLASGAEFCKSKKEMKKLVRVKKGFMAGKGLQIWCHKMNLVPKNILCSLGSVPPMSRCQEKKKYYKKICQKWSERDCNVTYMLVLTCSAFAKKLAHFGNVFLFQIHPVLDTPMSRCQHSLDQSP